MLGVLAEIWTQHVQNTNLESDWYINKLGRNIYILDVSAWIRKVLKYERNLGLPHISGNFIPGHTGGSWVWKQGDGTTSS
jgi:hypothetical protein